MMGGEGGDTEERKQVLRHASSVDRADIISRVVRTTPPGSTGEVVEEDGPIQAEDGDSNIDTAILNHVDADGLTALHHAVGNSALDVSSGCHGHVDVSNVVSMIANVLAFLCSSVVASYPGFIGLGHGHASPTQPVDQLRNEQLGGYFASWRENISMLRVEGVFCIFWMSPRAFPAHQLMRIVSDRSHWGWFERSQNLHSTFHMIKTSGIAVHHV